MFLRTKPQINDQDLDALYLDLYDLLADTEPKTAVAWLHKSKDLYSPSIQAVFTRVEHALVSGICSNDLA